MRGELRRWPAAQYGKEVVPLNEDMKRTLGYMPGPKALEFFGFVEAARVPLHMGMKARSPRKGDALSVRLAFGACKG